MTFTEDDYFPPHEDHLDTRRLALFADNRGLSWEFTSRKTAFGLHVTVLVDGKAFDAEAAEGQEALDIATDKAIDALTA